MYLLNMRYTDKNKCYQHLVFTITSKIYTIAIIFNYQMCTMLSKYAYASFKLFNKYTCLNI